MNAKLFQEPLAKLSEAVAQKVLSNSQIPESNVLFLMIRHCSTCYDYLFYLNADERRINDCFWRDRYGIVALTTIRTMIDILYNVTIILEDPSANGRSYQLAGLKKRLRCITELHDKNKGVQEWEEYYAFHKQQLKRLAEINGFREADIEAAKPWKTLGKFIQDKKPSPLTKFFSRFMHREWQQYSALLHAAYEGYIGDPPFAAQFTIDTFSPELRSRMTDAYPMILGEHIGRAAGVLLSLVTEIQSHFRFDGAGLNMRIVELWEILREVPEVEQLYCNRYRELMNHSEIVEKHSE